MKNDEAYMEHILEGIKKIEEYVFNIAKEKFMKKTLIHDAVIRQIEIIGEAST